MMNLSDSVLSLDSDRHPGTVLDRLCINAVREQFALRGIRARVVSMPSWELFDEQPMEYRAAVLGPAGVPRLAVEAGVSLGWSRYTGERGAMLGIERFGASAPGKEVLRHYGFSLEHVIERAQALLSTPAKVEVV